MHGDIPILVSRVFSLKGTSKTRRRVGPPIGRIQLQKAKVRFRLKRKPQTMIPEEMTRLKHNSILCDGNSAHSSRPCLDDSAVVTWVPAQVKCVARNSTSADLVTQTWMSIHCRSSCVILVLAFPYGARKNRSVIIE